MKSRMREIRTSGFVRGVVSNGYPYRVNSFNSSFLSNNNELLTSANLITSWEANTRYSNGICSNVNDINKCLSIAKKLYDDIVKIENNRISRDIQECKKNPLYLKNISFENQTQEIIQAALESCQTYEGVNPSDLNNYIDDKFKDLINNYTGYWAIDPYTGNMTWYN